MVEESNTEEKGTNLVPEIGTETPTISETGTSVQLRLLLKEDTTLATVCKNADSGAPLFLSIIQIGRDC